MFRCLFVTLMMTWSLLGMAATADDVAEDPVEVEDPAEEAPSSAEEEENDEPSLEEPTTPESNTFEAGEPPVTESSLEEEDPTE